MYCTLVGVSGAGDEEAGETHLLPKQLLSSSISSYGFSFDGGSSEEEKKKTINQCHLDYTTAPYKLSKEQIKYSFHISHVCFARRFLLQMCGELPEAAGLLTQLIFYCDKMLAQLKRNVTL